MGRSSFLLLAVCISTVAQPPTSAPKNPVSGSDGEKLSATSELALDAAKRWTREALDDSSNLPPLERDFLLARMAKAWNAIDHTKAEEYLKDAVDHLESSAPTAENVSEAVSEISSDVMAVDRSAWDRLIKLLQSSDASAAIATEAQTLAERGDPEAALVLERKSLERGGSWSDLDTLYSLIGTNQPSASKLFDEILKTASTPDSSPNLLSDMLRRLNDQDDVITRFLDTDRRQRLADTVAQRILSGKHEDACNYSLEATPLMSQYSTAMQAQFRAIVDDCNREGAYGPDGQHAALNSTDDLVRAMNEATDAQIRASLRRRAAIHAAHVDRDFRRAIRLCLEASPQERAGADFPFDRFDNLASNFALEALHTAVQQHDDLDLQQTLAVLTPTLRAHVEVNAVRLLSGKDKVQSLLMLSDARNVLEHEVAPHTITYFFMLSETAQLAPEDLNVSWRVLGSGLNRFAKQMRTQATASPGAVSQQTPAYLNPLYPWSVPQEALADESLVHAIVGDLTSPEFRACLRLAVVQAFLERYSNALKNQRVRPTTSVRTDG